MNIKDYAKLVGLVAKVEEKKETLKAAEELSVNANMQLCEAYKTEDPSRLEECQTAYFDAMTARKKAEKAVKKAMAEFRAEVDKEEYMEIKADFILYCMNYDNSDREFYWSCRRQIVMAGRNVEFTTGR